MTAADTKDEQDERMPAQQQKKRGAKKEEEQQAEQQEAVKKGQEGQHSAPVNQALLDRLDRLETVIRRATVAELPNARSRRKSTAL